MQGDAGHIPHPPVEVAPSYQVLGRVFQKLPVARLPALVVRHGQVEIDDGAPGKEAHVRRELRVPQLIEAPALLQAVQQFPRGFYAAANQLAKHSACVLRTVSVRYERPIGKG